MWKYNPYDFPYTEACSGAYLYAGRPSNSISIQVSELLMQMLWLYLSISFMLLVNFRSPSGRSESEYSEQDAKNAPQTNIEPPVPAENAAKTGKQENAAPAKPAENKENQSEPADKLDPLPENTVK